MMWRTVFACFLVALAFWPARPSSAAAEWFVATGGSGSGSATAPFGRIQDAINAARPGDVVIVRDGTYAERLQTVRSGVPGAPITLKAEKERGTVVVTTVGRVLDINHAHITVEGLVLDGQYGADDLVRVYSTAANLELRNLEMRRSSRDIIDMSNPPGVLIIGCLIHHALNPTDGGSDAHGIAAGAVQNLLIRDTEIHTFSGDGVQVDPGRSAPGWTGVTIEGSHIWLAPLEAEENGFPEGQVPGENAVDTKASASFARATIMIRDTIASGFRNETMANMAAFNLKENVDAIVDGVTVYDSEIAFRLRAPAIVAVKNAVVYDVSTAFRYEDNIQNLRIWNSTLGRDVTRAFQPASSSGSQLQVRNLLTMGPLPSEAAHASNRSVDAREFAAAARHDYQLAAGSSAIDAGITLPGVETDRAGVRRPQGAAFDIGAYEWRHEAGPAKAPPAERHGESRSR